MNNNYDKYINSLITHLEYTPKLKRFIESGVLKYVYFNAEIKYFKAVIDFFFKYDKSPTTDEITEILKDDKEVMDLMSRTVSADYFDGNYDFVIDNLREQYIQREFNSLKMTETLPELISKADKLYRETAECETGDKTKICEDTELKAEHVIAQKHIRPLRTGFTAFDNTEMGGFYKGEYYCFAGRTGSGKTRYIMCYAHGLCKHGAGVLFFSFEMTKWDIEGMYMAQELNIDMGALYAGRMDDNEIRDKFAKLKETGHNFTVIEQIDDRVPPTVEYIANEIDKHIRSGEVLDVVIIDYVQLLYKEGYKPSETHMMFFHISKGLRAVAARFGVVLIILAQTNRTGEKGERFSEKQIADSDKIARPCVFSAGIMRTDNPMEVNLDISKSRKGGSNLIKNEMDWAKNTLVELGAEIESNRNYYEPKKEDENPF